MALVWLLFNSSEIQITISEEEVEVNRIPRLYSRMDVVLILIFVFISMISTVSLFRESTKATKPYEYREILDKLQGAKRDIIEYVIEEGGAVRQTDIVQGTGLSKGTVSRTLKGLCDI